MLAYNTATGQAEAEPIQHVWRNHDSDLVDVGVTEPSSSNAGSATSASTSAAKESVSGISQRRWVPQRLAQAGMVAKAAQTVTLAAAASVAVLVSVNAPVAPAPARAVAHASAVQMETIHTTANHPWLTTDRGWVEAGNLRAGERVVTLDSGTSTDVTTAGLATVAWVQVVVGQANMYNLTVAKDHTYAVGDDHVVVHNDGCGTAPLYRNLRPDEDPAEGLYPRNPNSSVSPAGHIMNGSNPTFKGSRFISTTKSLDIATRWQGSSRMAVIDPSAVQSTLLDYSTPELARAAGFTGRVYARAVSSQEVLIEGFVPPEAIVQIIEPR